MYYDVLFSTDFNSEEIIMNNNDILFFCFKRRRRQHKGEHDDTRRLLKCLHLIVANATTRLASKGLASLVYHDC